MEPVIELRSEMRVRPKWIDWLLLAFGPVFIFSSGFYIGSWLSNPTISSELNRQEAQDVATDVFIKCDELFIPHGKNLYVTQLSNDKCQELFNIALDSGWKKREKKR